MTSCAVTFVAAIADTRAKAPSSANFVTGVLLGINQHAGRTLRTLARFNVQWPKLVQLVHLLYGKVHHEFRPRWPSHHPAGILHEQPIESPEDPGPFLLCASSRRIIEECGGRSLSANLAGRAMRR